MRTPRPQSHDRDPVAAARSPDVSIIDASRSVDARTLDWLRSNTLAAAAFLECSGEVRIKVVDDSEMAAAHVRYSNVEGTTDVLTFDLAEGASAQTRVLDVDILICANEARRRADERAHGSERELLLYIVHGVLHCLGHDDHSDEGFARMHALEDEVLEAVGVGPVFADHKSKEDNRS